MSLNNIKQLHSEIEQTLLTINPIHEYLTLTEKFIELCDLINEYEGETEDWLYIGEFSHCTLDNMIIGAFWHYTEWHDGQYSISYAALCALGSIYEPNMCDGVEDGTTEQDVYNELNNLAKKVNV